jgi:pSer/pThr/pTyr-binding forkhead associated (FHA) protein
MSLIRLVYYSAFIAGWAAFLGWGFSEWMFFGRGAEPGAFQVIFIAGIIGAAIGLGLNVVAGMANARWKQLLRRALPGLVGGCLGGAVGGMIGNLLYALGLPRAIGWLIMGLGIGVVEGVYEKSRSKIRNGLIGGGIGGLLGGVLFDPIQYLIATDSGMSSRATAFVILAICIGAFVGLAQVVLKEAWLTVLDGYRAGRQLILSQPITALGRADHLALPFLGPMNKDVEAEHVKITRRADGSYVVEDNHTRLGTRLNNQPLQGQVVLKNGDVMKFGTNFVRFNERQHRSAEEAPAATTASAGRVSTAPPPPPVVGKRPVAATPPPSKAPPPDKGFYQGPNTTPAKPATPGKIAPPPPPRRPKAT